MCRNELSEKQKRAWEFVTTFVNLYESYHNHKENMAYSAAATYLAVLGAGLFLEAWPPKGFLDNQVLGLIVLLVLIFGLHVIVILFLKWQLSNRAVAAIYVGAGIRTLVKWMNTPPEAAEMEPLIKNKESEENKQSDEKGASTDQEETASSLNESDAAKVPARANKNEPRSRNWLHAICNFTREKAKNLSTLVGRIRNSIKDGVLAIVTKTKKGVCVSIVFSKECIWPSRHITPFGDIDRSIYPKALFEACDEQICEGTGAVVHSRFVLCSCWVFFLLLVGKTVWNP